MKRAREERVPRDEAPVDGPDVQEGSGEVESRTNVRSWVGQEEKGSREGELAVDAGEFADKRGMNS